MLSLPLDQKEQQAQHGPTEDAASIVAYVSVGVLT
jgi:hypothetical protein